MSHSSIAFIMGPERGESTPSWLRMCDFGRPIASPLSGQNRTNKPITKALKTGRVFGGFWSQFGVRHDLLTYGSFRDDAL